MDQWLRVRGQAEEKRSQEPGIREQKETEIPVARCLLPVAFIQNPKLLPTHPHRRIEEDY